MDFSSSVASADEVVSIEANGNVYQFLISKNQELERKRGVGFLSLIPMLTVNNVVDVIVSNQAKHPGHQIMVVNINSYLHEVPFLAHTPTIFFLKTVYPSRKMMLKYWGINRKSKKTKKKERASHVSISVNTVSVDHNSCIGLTHRLG